MKGTLKNKEGKWVVIYAERSQNETEQIKSKYKKIIELPLHPEQQSLTPNPFNNYGKGQEVEFEIVDGESWTDAPYGAKLISKQEVLPNEQKSWDEIEKNFARYLFETTKLKVSTFREYQNWLIQNYHPPTEK